MDGAFTKRRKSGKNLNDKINQKKKEIHSNEVQEFKDEIRMGIKYKN